MKRLILGMLGIVGLFLASEVYAAGTATAKFDTLTVTTLTLGSANLAKVPVMTDNVGSKMDSGSANLSNGSVTVTTSLTAVDRIFLQLVAYGSNSVNLLATATGTTFTAQGYYGTESTAYVGTGTIHWLAIDE